MKTKQTAVEWLIDKLEEDISLGIKHYNQIIEQAKAMEKEQMIDMWMDGNTTFIFNGTAEQYYNETYENYSNKG